MGYTARDWPLMCCICFEGLTPEKQFVDNHGDMWDVCKGQCAIDAGMVDASQDH